MDVLVFGFLFLGIAVIWQRLQRAEERLRQLEYAVSPAEARRPARVVETHAEPDDALAEATPAPEQPEPARFTPPEPEPQPEPEQMSAAAIAPDKPAEAPTSRFVLNFEDLFGRLLPIWAGGITLAVAGFFLVRYSIELGLLTPAVRVLLSFLFGLGLLGGAELAYRQEHRIRDPRVRQALAGAGLATLYAGFLLAGRFYGLIGTAASFAGLAAITVGALGLAGRFGLPAAILGLVGGFAAPMLVGGSEANMPVLTLYLALITAGLTLVAKRQRWAWLGLAAIGASLGWGGLLLLGSIAPGVDSVAFALYLAVIGLGVPLLAAEADTGKFVRIGAAIVAAAQLAVLVASGGFEPLTWALYLLLIGAMTFLSARDETLRPAALFAQSVSVLLMLVWPEPEGLHFAIVGVIVLAIASIRPIVALVKDKADALDLGALFGLPLGVSLVAMATFGADLSVIDVLLGAGIGAIAAVPIAATFLLRQTKLQDGDIWQLAMGALGSALFAIALLIATPLWLTPVMMALVSATLTLGIRRSGLEALRPLTSIGAILSVLTLVVGVQGDEWGRLVGEFWATSPDTSLLRWGSAAAAAFITAHLLGNARPARTVQAFGAFAAYGFAAQLLPEAMLAGSAAFAAVAACLHPRLSGARNGWLAIASLWALPPMLHWLYVTIGALEYGQWYKVSDLPDIWPMTYSLLPFIVAVGAIAWRVAASRKRTALVAVAGGAALMLLHTLFKQVLAIDSGVDFAAYAYLERSMWQAVLLGKGAGAWMLRDRIAQGLVTARLMAGAALAHFTVFSLWNWNPLWTEQAVGPTPIANLLLVGFGTALGAIWLLRKLGLPDRMRPYLDAGTMLLIALLALSLLRQIFTGTLMFEPPIGAFEDLMRSLTGIAVAIGLLAWGSYREERSWRIGSLVLITVAVLKVFLHDAADLEGLLRIGSFVALGFSLIGIGWFYSRQLRSSEGGLSGGHSGGMSG